MKLSFSILVLAGLLFAGGMARADTLEGQFGDLRVQEMVRRRQAGEKPRLDPKRIINESSSFLKEREPEMNAEEYAVYERVVGMLATRPDFALKLLEAMMNDKEPPSPAFQFILGNAYYSAGDYVKSEASYRDAVKRFPTFLRAWSNLGVMYYTSQRYAEAITCFAKCVALGERDPMTYGLMGYSLEQVKKIVPAEVAYMQALAGDPDNPDWQEGLLRIYVDGRQYGRAEPLVKDLIRQRPGETRFWLTEADILLAQGRKTEAMAVLEVCVNTGIAGANELDALAGLYTEQQLVPEAIAVYRRMGKTAPELGERKLLALAQVLLGAGQLAPAEQVLQSLGAVVSPGGAVAFRLVHADLLAARKQWPQARAELDGILQSEPLNGRALLSLGRAYVAENNLPRAQLAFESAAQVPDTTYRACLELATLELKGRHYDKSVQYLERALTLESTPAVQDLLARIRPLTAKNY